MSLALVHSRARAGVSAPPVRVEVHLSGGLPLTHIVGLPEAAVQRAREVLRQLEEGSVTGKADRMLDDLPLFSAVVKREAAPPPRDTGLLSALGAINPDELTPREALDALYRLKGML